MCPFAFSTGVPDKRLAGKGVPRDCQKEKLCMVDRNRMCRLEDC